jgi:hypothetical protein
MKNCQFNWETETAKMHYEKGKALSNKTSEEKNKEK